MMPRAALTQLGKIIAKEMELGQMSEGTRSVGDALAAAPDSILEIIGLLATESRKKNPNESLMEAFAFMIGQALERLRFGIDRNYKDAADAVEAVRERVLALAQAEKFDPGALLLVLRQFVGAKLELGADLEAAVGGMTEREAAASVPRDADIDGMLADMVLVCEGDIFSLQAELAEQVSTFPESHRAGIVMGILGASDAALRESAIGWLLDTGATTRRDTAMLLQQAASAGRVSGVMLRRLIAMRNWLPEAERQAADGIIRACRQKGIECAPLPPSTVIGIAASAIDGSGAQSLFIVVRDGRKQAVAAMLLKQDIGVRDAWVRAGLTKSEAEMFRRQVEIETDCYDCSLEYAQLALGHALAVSQVSGVLPVFGLVDVIERAGLGAVNPQRLETADLVARLAADIPADRQTAAMVATALKGSSSWPGKLSAFESWFEDDGAIDTLLAAKRLPVKRQTALVLEEYLPARRARWAELLAWSALMLRQDSATGETWIDLALVSRELLGDRPLAEIPIMSVIAKQTVAAWQSRLF